MNFSIPIPLKLTDTESSLKVRIVRLSQCSPPIAIKNIVVWGIRSEIQNLMKAGKCLLETARPP